MNVLDSNLNATKSTFEIGSPDFKPAYRCHLAILTDEDGGISVLVLNLPGAGSCGDTEDEAIANAIEAVSGVIASYVDDGKDIPWITEYDVPEGAKLKWILVNA